MKLRIVKSVLLAVTASVLAVGLTTTVLAGPAISFWPDGSLCAIWDGDGNLVTSDKFHVVITNSKDGNTIFTCQAKDVDNSTGEAVHYDMNNHPSSPYGDECGLTLDGVRYSSYDWKGTVSASGSAKYKCKLEGLYYPIP